MRSNKKSQIDPTYWILFMLTVGVLALSFYFIADLSVKQRAKVSPSLEEYVFKNRFYSGNECFAYQDKHGDYLPMTIDLNKFNDGRMEKCYPAKSKTITAVSLSLLADGKKIEVYSPNWDKDNGPDMQMAPVPVTVYGEDKEYQSMLMISEQNIKRI